MNRLTLGTMLTVGLTPLAALAQDGYVRPTWAIVMMVIVSIALIASIVFTITATIRFRRTQEGDPSDRTSGEIETHRRTMIGGGISAIVLVLLLMFVWQWRVYQTNFPVPTGSPSAMVVEGGVADILDHHIPDVGAQNVPRNTSLYLWFSVPMDRGSIIDDHHTDTPADDTVRDDHIRIWQGDITSTVAAPLVGVRARSDSDNRIFALDPLSALGSALREQVYTVELRGLATADGKSAFGTNGYYRWSFTTARTSDTSIPSIMHVYPNTAMQPSAINTGIQLEWNKGLDPLSFASGISVANGSQEIPGTWTIATGERLTEFFSSTVCGLNACRRDVTCLPPSATITVAARSVDATAYPRQGIRDFQGNLVPASTPTLATIHTGETVDQSTPVITAVEPRPNASGVDPHVPVHAQFSTVLRASSITRQSVQLQGDGRWRAQASTNFDKQISTITIDHEALLPEAVVNAIVSSDIEDMHQNCFAECKGP